MLDVLASNTLQILLQALLAGLLAVIARLLSWLVKIKAKKPRPYRFRVDLGVASAALVIVIGGTREEREALIDTRSDSRDG